MSKNLFFFEHMLFSLSYPLSIEFHCQIKNFVISLYSLSCDYSSIIYRIHDSRLMSQFKFSRFLANDLYYINQN